VSAYAELRAGQTGTAFADLLGRTVLAVALRGGFPPPDGGQWSGAKANDVAVSFLTHHRTPKIIDSILLTCGDEQTLARVLQGVVRNFLRDLGRATEMGRLVVRVRRALRESEIFESVPGDRWALAGEPSATSGIGPDALASAASSVPITFQPWSPTARRNEPFADRDSIEALITAVLTAAGGSLQAGDLARALAPSLQVVPGPVLAELDPGDHPAALPLDLDVDQLGNDVANRDRAREVFAVLSDRERIALAYVDLNSRELGGLLQLGHSQAAIIKNRAIELLQRELGDESDGQEVAELVLEITKLWSARRTDRDDETYKWT
jgi:hypothetical protein